MITAPTRPFLDVLNQVASRLGWDPERLQYNQAPALARLITHAMQTCWRYQVWPECTRCELLPAADSVIPYAAPLESQLTTGPELLTNPGFDTSALAGWTQSGEIWSATTSAASFSTTNSEAAEAEDGLRQTITGLTTGAVYTATAVLIITGSYGSVRLDVLDAADNVLATSTLTNSGTLTSSFTATGGTAKIVLVLVPSSATALTGSITSTSVKLVSSYQIRRRPAIDTVSGVFLDNPETTEESQVRHARWLLQRDGIKFIYPHNALTEAWVRWRPEPPRFTTVAYDANTAYQAGGLTDLAFDPTSGQCYRFRSITAASAVPLTDERWELQPIPEFLAAAIVCYATADALEEQDQYNKAGAPRQQANSLLEDAAYDFLHRSRQHRNYRTQPQAPAYA